MPEARRGADHRGDVGRVVVVDGHDRRDHLDVVAETLGEQGPQGRSIMRAARMPLSRGTAFPPEPTAGDAADGVHPFFVVDEQRKEVDAFARDLASSPSQDHRVPVADQHGGVGSARPAAGLEDRGGRPPNSISKVCFMQTKTSCCPLSLTCPYFSPFKLPPRVIGKARSTVGRWIPCEGEARTGALRAGETRCDPACELAGRAMATDSRTVVYQGKEGGKTRPLSLTAKTELFDQRPVPIHILGLQIIEQAMTLPPIIL